jgi:peptidoglycan/xylan/chitin deacetylase (PgdA/CDA1 family)
LNALVWPHERVGAVSLTFDDAIPSQLSTAIPALEEQRLRATFYVCPDERWRANAAAWRAVHSRGHEIGNHTPSHPCSGSFHLNRGKPLEEMSLDEIEHEIRDGREAIDQAIPSQRSFSFCYPCYQDFVGQGGTRQSYVPVVAKYHPAARGWGECPNDPAQVDLHHVLAFPCEYMRGTDLIDLCELATDGRWVVLVFHGIGEAHQPVGKRHLRKLCGHLARHRDRLWTAPLVDVAERVEAWRRETGSQRERLGTSPGIDYTL